jgi:hypothetical protein
MRSNFLIPRRYLINILGVIASLNVAFTQNVPPASRSIFYREFHHLEYPDSVIRLQHQFIVIHSERVTIDTLRLRDSIQYILDTRYGILSLHFRNILHDLSPHDTTRGIVIEYRALPFALKNSYQHRVPVIMTDSTTKKSVIMGKPTAAFSLDDIFGSNLQKSGSIVRGFTIGSNRDLSLNSGLRMQMSGNLTSDLLLVAALTDENSPLQPEGTTRTLQEVDNVFVEVRGSKLGATLGDFNVDLGGTEFARIQRKLQGARGNISFDAGDVTSRITAIGAAPRGKFATNQFDGLDGVQGPYQLFGQNNENNIIVIAGTERVYLNGEQMTRGDVNDYVIDYSTAELTFTPHRLISRASRITVDFEYSDRQYDRSFLAVKSEQTLLTDRVSLQTTFIREGDDENSPIDVTLADSDKTLLQQAGNDPLKASRSGVQVVGPGKGQYVAVDTLVKTPAGTDTLVTIYSFNPFDSLHAIYSVTFQFVGFGMGDYNKVTSTQFRFVGLRQGGYLPVRFLPLPTSQSLMDIALAGKVSDDFRVDGEYSYSAYNGNLFSLGSAAQQNGDALNLGATYATKHLILGNLSLGGVQFTVHDRRLASTFRSLDRLNDVEFNRIWNITDSTSADEEDREGTLVLHPVSSIQGTASIGEVKRGDIFSSSKINAALKIVGEAIPSVDYGIDEVRADDEVHAMSSLWLRQHGIISSRFGKFSPGFTYTGEILQAHQSMVDTLLASSYRLNEFQPSVLFDSLGRMRIQLSYGIRLEDSLSDGTLRRAATVHTQHLMWGLQDWNNLNSNLELTFQQKNFSLPSHQTDNDNSIVLRWQGRYSTSRRIVEADGFYEIVTERTAKLERVFQQVPIGTGNYVYAGDLNGNHVVDENDFQPTRFDGNFISLLVPSDQLVPDVGLKVSSRIRFNGSQLSLAPSWYSRALGAFSSETYIRVEEKSTDPQKSDIYLLRFSHFLSDATTLAGTDIITQDFFLFENDPGLSLRFRFNQASGLTQLDLGGERTYRREQSIRLRWQLIPEVSNQTDVALQRDNLTAAPGNPRLRNVKLVTLSTEWVYRPVQRVELGMIFGTGRGSNYDSIEATLNNQSIRMVYSFNERGQGKVEFTREEVGLISAFAALPFEMTGGEVVGLSWLWHLGFDYRITQFLQASLTYDGRSEGKAPPVHTAKAEVRAFF